jgi:uncharacterized iron-regulated membrane protein
MVFLGLSGLYLWWPKKGQWKFAFGVRRTARGFRLYREIHGMMGVWFWLVFLFVSITSIPLGFPTVLGLLTGNAPRGGPLPVPAGAQMLGAPEGTSLMGLTTLIAHAAKISGAEAVAVTVPAQPNRAISVTLKSSYGDPERSLAFNPYTGAILAQPGQARDRGLSRRVIEQLHGGQRLGPVWKLLVFLSGFLPLIFVTTGFMMWLKKRRNRLAFRRVAASIRAGVAIQAGRASAT